MSYTTKFIGQFDFNEPISSDGYDDLLDTSKIRHGGRIKTSEDKPSFYCGWAPTEDRKHLKWNGLESFYNYVEWLEWLIKRIIEPNGCSLSGKMCWFGEELGDVGTILVDNNNVTIKKGEVNLNE